MIAQDYAPADMQPVMVINGPTKYSPKVDSDYTGLTDWK
jgi:hypothetical protein